MSLFSKFSRNKQEHEANNFNPTQEDRIILRCIASIEHYRGDITKAVDDSFKKFEPFSLESTFLMVTLTDFTLFQEGVTTLSRGKMFDGVISNLGELYAAHVFMESESLSLRDVAFDRMDTYTNIICGDYKPIARWFPFSLDDDIGHNLLAALGNYIFYSVFYSKIILGDYSSLPSLTIDVFSSLKFNSTMIEIFKIIGENTAFINEIIKLERLK